MRTRRSLQTDGRQPPGRRALVCALVVAVVVTACTGQPPDTDPPLTPTGPSPVESTTDVASTPAPEATSEPEADPTAEVRALWEDAHRRRLEATYDAGAVDAVAFQDVADESTADVLASFAAAGRPAVPSELRDTQQGTEVTVDVATATIRGCVLAAVGPDDGSGAPALTATLWEGEARRLPVGWRLTKVELATGECVPAAFADGAVGAHASWVQTYNEWWDPPNPDDPRIAQLMADPALTGMRDLLAEHLELGIAVRDDHDPSAAVVTDLQGDVVTVSDCYAAADGRAAAYDLESRDLREDLTPQPGAGQLDALVVDLRWDGPGEWTVVGWSSRVDAECRPGETDYVVIP